MLLAFGLTYLSCLALSISMKRHFQQLFPSHSLSSQKIFILRGLGWLLLISSGIACTQSYGIATGLVLLCGLFSAAAFLIALLLHYSPRTTIALVVIQSLLALIVVFS